MKRRAALITILLLASAMAASAAISPDGISKKKLNIGDKLAASYNITSDTETEAILKLGLQCPAFNLEYYTIPMALRTGQNKSIIAPQLTAKQQMIGRCTIKATVQSTDNAYREEQQSEEFEITDTIGVELETNGNNFYPGEKLEVTGKTSQSFTPVKTITITLEKQTITLIAQKDSFNQTIALPKTMNAGRHLLIVTANDTYGNEGTSDATITIAQVPTTITINAEKQRASPGEELKITAKLLDQANDTMNGSVDITITSQDKKELANTDVQSGEKYSYRLDQYASPGVYTIRAASQGLKAEERVVISTVEQITTDFDGTRIITIKNVGNIDYDKYTDIKLNSPEKGEVSLVRRVKLKPGQETKYDLYQEVPQGKYTVSFMSAGQKKEYKDVATKDERGFGKKIGDAIGGITGLVIGGPNSQGAVFKKPFLAIITLLAIMVLVIVIYRGEKQRRKELAQRQAEPIQAPKAAAASQPELNHEREQHKKFVEDMLKEKQFK